MGDALDFKALFEQAPGLLLVLDEEFKILGVSEAYLAATMTKRAEILGRNIFDVFPDNPNDSAATGVSNLRASLESVLKNKTPHAMAIQKYDIRRPASEGGGFEERHWSPVNSPVFNENGELAYIVHRVEDVTEYVRLKRAKEADSRAAEVLKDRAAKMEAEIFQQTRKLQESQARLVGVTESLRQSETHLGSMIESVKDYAIFMLDPDGNILTWNEGVERINGYAKHEIVGRHFSTFYPPEDLATRKPSRDLTQAAAKGRVEDEGWRVRKDGSRFWANVIITALRDESGKLVGFTKVTRDMTERKRFEDALIDAKAAAETATKEIEGFSYTVAHDLKGPLRTISSFSQIVMKRSGAVLDAASKRDLDMVVAACGRMRGIIEGLLRLAQLTRHPLHLERVSLTDMARSIAAELLRIHPDRDIKIEVPDGMGIVADAELIYIVLQNFLDNALKFTRPRKHALIEVGCTRREGEAVFFVKDNGAGFDMAYAEKLFVPFQRLHKPEEFPGTGLGLASAQRIILKHGGRVWAEAQPDKGATFYFTSGLDR